MRTKSIRMSEYLVIQAKRKAKVYHRSLNGQLEFWAKLGKAIEDQISVADAYSIAEGLKNIHVESRNNVLIDPDDILNELETDRKSKFVDKPITTAPYYFEASISKPGFLDKVVKATGERQTGKFKNGIFEVI